MKLAEWLAREGVKRNVFARRIGVSPGAVTQICRDEGAWLSRETAQRILAETRGAVTPNDFLDGAVPSDWGNKCRITSIRPSRRSRAARSLSSPTTTTARTKAT